MRLELGIEGCGEGRFGRGMGEGTAKRGILGRF